MIEIRKFLFGSHTAANFESTETLNHRLTEWLSRISCFSIIAGAASMIAVPRESRADRPAVPDPAPSKPDLSKPFAALAHAGIGRSPLLRRQSEYRLPSHRSNLNMFNALSGSDNCPGTLIPPGNYTAAAPYIDSGDTSGANNTVVNYAGSYYYTQIAGPDHIYTFTLSGRGPNARIEVSTTSTTYDPAIYVVNGLTYSGCPAGTNNEVYALVADVDIQPGATEVIFADSLPLNVPLHLFIDSSSYTPISGRTGPYTVRMLEMTISDSATPPSNDAPLDMDGDGTTDHVIVRNTDGQLTWFTRTGGATFLAPQPWGVEADKFVPADYDGDGRDDIAVWRPGPQGRFYIIHSRTQTLAVEDFGQTGDDPTVVADYTGDGIEDIAVYRPGASAGAQSYWFYRSVFDPPGNHTTVAFGQHGDRPVPGHYFLYSPENMIAVQRAEGQLGRFYIRPPWGGFESVQFGLANDILVPGDYNDDWVTDLAVVRPNANGFFEWHYLPSGFPPATNWVSSVWGVAATDVITQGDYDGDGRTELSVWRPGSPGTFYHRSLASGAFTVKQYGEIGDLPAASFNHR